MFYNFSTFYRPNNCETYHICLHVICRPLPAARRLYIRDYRRCSEKLVKHDNSWIVSRFCQCADGKVEALSDALQATVAKWKARLPMPIPLELYTSSTFIGLFVEEQVAELLKGFAADFSSEAATKAGLIYHRILVESAEQEHHICIIQDVQALQTWCAHVFLFCPDVHMEPHKKQLHVTLAYHFHASHLLVLEKLAKNLDVSSGCDWLAVLYSRDIRFANHEVAFLVSTLSKCVRLSAVSLSNAYRQHPRCRRCRSCTRMHLRMTTSWSWCLETSSSCRLWSRAPSARVGCTEPRWPRGCRACCLRTTSIEQMSPTPGSSMGKKRMFLCQDFQSEHKCTQRKWLLPSDRSRFWICFSVSVWRSGPTQFSTVHLHLTPAALLAGYYSMESSVTVCSTALWMLPAPLASALRCRCNIQPLASGSLSCVYW